MLSPPLQSLTLKWMLKVSTPAGDTYRKSYVLWRCSTALEEVFHDNTIDIRPKVCGLLSQFYDNVIFCLNDEHI